MDEERVEPSGQPTGDPRVDQAIEGLADLGEMPLDDHPAALEAVHDGLREILGELGDAGKAAGQSRPGESGKPGGQGQPGLR